MTARPPDRVDSNNLPPDELGELSAALGQVSMDTDENILDDESNKELPNVLIVTNVHDNVFTDERAKARFETIFRSIEDTASIIFLRNFRRARVEYSQAELAARARIQLNEIEICGQPVKCYFGQVREKTTGQHSPHLQLPAPVKQYLISPPASPPVGWEPVEEAQPILNYDLLSAITQLAPGEAHELHAPSGSQPSIVVHVCEDPEGFSDRPIIQQTRRPTPEPTL